MLRPCTRCGRLGLPQQVKIDSSEFDRIGKTWTDCHRVYYLCDMCFDSLDSWFKGIYPEDEPKSNVDIDLLIETLENIEVALSAASIDGRSSPECLSVLRLKYYLKDIKGKPKVKDIWDLW